MRRRDFITLFGGAAAAWPMAAQAQQARRIPRVGVLWHATRAEEEKGPLIWFRRGLNDMGYVEGENIIVEYRFPNEEAVLFRQYAQELAALKPDVLATVTRPAAIAMTQDHDDPDRVHCGARSDRQPSRRESSPAAGQRHRPVDYGGRVDAEAY